MITWEQRVKYDEGLFGGGELESRAFIEAGKSKASFYACNWKEFQPNRKGCRRKDGG